MSILRCLKFVFIFCKNYPAPSPILFVHTRLDTWTRHRASWHI